MEETTYQELTIKLDQEYIEFIADFVANIYGDGVELGDGQIVVRSENDLSFVQDAVESLVGTLGGVIDVSFHLEEKKNVDWIKEYQDSIQPIEAGEFYIYPSWFQPKENKINIKIDPALAFGSGHHATTFSCLEAIGSRVKGGERVLDVGCGSGILGLACTKMGALVELCDTDPLSVTSTKENFILNEALYAKIWEGSTDKAEGEYDVVIANIIADVLKFIASDLKKLTKPKGTLILSGILDTKLSSILDTYSDLKLVEQKHKDEWVTLIYHKETDV
ncbi:Ribosomal protein L11 methyltransferase [hydrothermal vent metagenome]|uniref:Ribosomal protein L11 methyltransferase n=1 Tax=hydrothermal vent metagenome TaxID=652676 RepID=A0A1W1BMY7_9ZZZZ